MTGEHRSPSSYPSVVPERAWLASLLMRHHERFFPRFVAAVARLRFVPRGLRRRMQRKAAVTLAGAALVLALGAANFGPPGAGVVHANNITVANGEVALNAGNGACSLIEAVLNANADSDLSNGDCGPGSGPDVIELPANGSFTFTASYVTYNGKNGLPVVTTEITIEGNGSTINLGGLTVGIRMANVTYNGVTTGDLTISNTTITDGYVVDSFYGGGGIFRVDGGHLTISESTLQNSSTNRSGGAILVRDGGTLTVTNESIITGNTAFKGGGIYSSGSYTDTDLILSTVSYNSADRGGGGIHADGGSLDITHSTITENFADYFGGGILASDTTLTIFGTTVSYNITDGYGGGGAAVFRSPTSPTPGVTIERSTFHQNSAGVGGGILLGGSNDGIPLPVTAEITNSTFSKNYADQYGGGIFTGGGNITLNNVTVTGNKATGNTSGGGGLFVGYDLSDTIPNTLNLNRTLISGNEAVSGDEIFSASGNYAPAIYANNYNLFGHSGLSLTDAFDGSFSPSLVGTDIVATTGGTEPTALSDILASNLSANSFSVNQVLPDPITQIHALSPNSPAVDRAPSAACTAAPVYDIDQRGEARNIDIPGVGNAGGANLCDIGAYELQPSVLGTCPAGADNERTDILGIGMGSPKKHKNTAKIVIPNAADVVSLYGQLAGSDDGNANYVRFMYPGRNNYVQVNSITSPAPHSAAMFWYGTPLDPAANVRGRWFLQPNGAKKHIPRAFVLYPTYETEPHEMYVNVFELLHPADTQVHWDVAGGWTQSRRITIEMPPPAETTTLTVKLALVGNDKDKRPIYITVSAGMATRTLQPDKPDRGDQLNILTFTLQGVQDGTDEIVIDIVSPDPNNSELGGIEGDSAALIGMTANYSCEISQ